MVRTAKSAPYLGNVGSNAFGNESSVAIYMDGVFFSRIPVSMFALSNVERVEVLKGPQGTLFGRNSTGGVIQVITKDPSHTPSIKASIGYGRRETTEGYLYATTGITDSLAADISISGRYQGKGYGINHTNPDNKAGYENYFSLKSKLLFEPSDRTKFTLSLFHGYSKIGYHFSNTYPGTTRGYESLPFPTAPLQPLPFWDQDSDLDQFSSAKLWGAALKAEQDVGFGKFTSISAIHETRSLTVADGDGGPRPDGTVMHGGPVRVITQELQLASNAGGPLHWVAGLYYYNTLSAYNDPPITLRSPSGNFIPASIQAGGLSTSAAGLDSTSEQRARSYAAYVQATYEITGRLKLTGGTRFTHDKTSAEGSILFGTVSRVAIGLEPLQIAGPPAHFSASKFTYKAALDYQLTDEILTYASFSTGYKAGIFNLLTYNPVPNKAETVTAYEVGIKSDLFDRRLRLNAAAFWTDLKNPQVQISRGAGTLFSNAGGARSKGFEAEATALLARSLTLRGSLAYLDSKYTDYVGALCTPINPNPPYGRIRPSVPCDATGNYTPRAAKFTGNLGLDYSIDTNAGDFDVTVDYSYNSGYYFAPANELRQPAYDVINAQIRFKPTDYLGFRAWVKNLTNAKYADRADEFAGPAGSVYLPAPPRMYGLAVDFSF